MSSPNSRTAAQLKKRLEFRGRIRLSRAALAAAPIRFTAAAPKPDQTEALTIGTISSYGLMWNALSSDRGGYKVRLMPNSATMADRVYALHNHNFGQVLGTNFAGTLRVKPADAVGIPIEIDLPNTTIGNDVATLAQRGDLPGMSFCMVNGFEQSFASKEGDDDILNVTRFTVDEFSILADPAFVQTSVAYLPLGADAANNDDNGSEPDDDESDQDYKTRRRHEQLLQRYRLDLMRL